MADKNEIFLQKLTDALAETPALTWQSVSSGERIEVKKYTFATVNAWNKYAEKQGAAEMHLVRQLEADPSDKMKAFTELFFAEDTRVSYLRPTKKPGEYRLHILVFFRDYYVGIKTKIITA